MPVLAWLMVLLAGLGALLVPGVARAADDSLTAVARALAAGPVYVSSGSGTPRVDPAAIRSALPPQTVVAVLPESALRGTEGGVDTLAPELSARLGRGGTVIVLAGRRLGAASTTVAGQLGDDLATARGVLAARPSDPAAPGLALTTLERSVAASAGAGIAPDPSAAPRAGSPGGTSGLYALLALVLVALVLGGLRLLRRRRRRAPRRPAPVPSRRTRVEVDAYGQVIRRIRPDEQD